YYAGAYESLLRSTDNGTTWNEVATVPRPITALAVRRSGGLWIGTAALYYEPGLSGVFRFDGGPNPALSAATNTIVTSIVVMPNGVAYAGTEGICDLSFGTVLRCSRDETSWSETPLSAAVTALVADSYDGVVAGTDGNCGHLGSYPSLGILTTSGPATT